jgi:hypothetical protein
MKSAIKLAAVLELIIWRITVTVILRHSPRCYQLLIVSHIVAIIFLRVLLQNVAVLVRYALALVFGGRLSTKNTIWITLPHLSKLVLVRVRVRMVPLPKYIITLISVGVIIELLLEC